MAGRVKVELLSKYFASLARQSFDNVYHLVCGRHMIEIQQIRFLFTLFWNGRQLDLIGEN